MDTRLSVVIPTGDENGHVFRTVEQVRRSPSTAEILVVCDPSTSTAIASRLQALWSAPSVRCLVVDGVSPGAVRNASVAAASGDLIMFLEAGDTIDPGYLPEACGRLSTQADLTCVTAWARRPGAAGLTTLTKPTLTLAAVLGDREPIPGPTIFRRTTWEAVGRFDEDLPSCEWYELWIRWLAAGFAATVIEEPLIGHEPSRQSAIRQRLDPDRYLAGMRRVFEKHLALFQEDVVRALCDRETSLKELYAHYHGLLRLRDSLVPERTVLLEETERSAHELRLMNGSSFEWGELRRILPVSPNWGWERGEPIDRYYIERFLESHATDVLGRVLEVQEADYTRRFGGDRVVCSDVIDANPANARANLLGDLRRLDSVRSDQYDCIILTQTLHVIDDVPAVLREAMRILKPGGVLLATLPCASRVCLEYGRDGDFWRFTEAGARRLFAGIVPSTHLETQSFGNVLSCVAFLEGLACHELSAEELEMHDAFYPLLVGVRAVKPTAAPEVLRRRPQGSGAILLYHRVTETALDVHGLCVSPADFRAQMTYLTHHCRLMPLAQLATAVCEGWLPERAVAVTFDDGYVDNLLEASPILLEERIPATFFITSATLLGGEQFWWDALAAIFFGPETIPTALEIDLGGKPARLPTATAADRQQTHDFLYPRLRAADATERARLLGAVRQWANVAADDASARPMNRLELDELARRTGHSIGGHGADHLWLSAHTRDVVQREIRDNRILLETAIGRPVTSFAYPFGDHDDQSVAIVGDLGYQAAVTCIEGAVRPGMNPLRLPRVVVEPSARRGFEEHLSAVFANAPRAHNK